MKAEPEALTNFTRAWLEAVEYVKTHPEVFEAYGKKYALEPAAITHEPHRGPCHSNVSNGGRRRYRATTL